MQTQAVLLTVSLLCCAPAAQDAKVPAPNAINIEVVFEDDNGNIKVISVPAKPDLTVIDVLGPHLGDNFDEWTKRSVYVQRTIDGKPAILCVDMSALFKGGSTATNYLLESGDRIRIEPKLVIGEFRFVSINRPLERIFGTDFVWQVSDIWVGMRKMMGID